MANFLAITLQGEVRGRQVWSKQLTIRGRTKVPVLRELVEEGFHVKGTLSYQEKNIHQKMGTLEDLQVVNGAVLKIKNYQKMSKDPMKDLSLYITPQREWCTIQVPSKITVRLLKFLIECKQRVLIPHQALIKDGQRWAEDANASYECTKEELQQLQVEDVSRRQNTPQNTPQHHSPKTDIITFPAAERELSLELSTDTESGGSEHNLDNGQDRVSDADRGRGTATEGGATKQNSTGVEESRFNPKISRPQYLPKRPTKSDKKDVVYPLTKKTQVLAPLPEGPKNVLIPSKPTRASQGIT